MSGIPFSDQGTNENGARQFSCTTCRQRKVRCNRSDPCSNCVKTGSACQFVPPAPSRRRKRNPAKEGLHARLSRYERILQSYGAKVDASNMPAPRKETPAEDDLHINSADEMEIILEDDSQNAIKFENPMNDKSKRAKLVSQRGKSRYIDNDLWSTLTQEVNDPGDFFSDGSDDNSTEPVQGGLSPLDENALLLGMSNNQSLNALHPPNDVLLKLCEVFHENVNPLIKIIHGPSFQTKIDAFCVAPYQLSKGTEALLFAVYLSAVCSLEEEECVQITGETRDTVVSRYRAAAQQALANATFLKSTSIVTLQAYYIYLVAARPWYDSSTLLCLTGVALRIARRLGLHRDGGLLGLPPFEVEMRRRLWWQISFFDGRTADLCGSRPSLDLQCDTRQPLNVNDADLSPDMIEAPQERPGLTDMLICMLKCQVGDILRRVAPPMSIDGLRRSSMSLAGKDEVINRLQDTLEQKLLRFCDPLQPLHLLCSIACRLIICKLRISVHNPAPYTGHRTDLDQLERDIIFDNGMKVIAYGNMLHSSPSLRRFRWFIGANFMWDSIIYTLIEVRRRKNDPKTDHAWTQITELFENYPQVITESGNPLYTAVGNWTLNVWEEWFEARKGAAPLKIPDFITRLRRNRTKSNVTSPVFLPDVPTDPLSVGGNLLGHGQVDRSNQLIDLSLNIPYGNDPLNLLDIQMFQPYTVDWTSWTI